MTTVDKKVKISLLSYEDDMIIGEIRLKQYGLWQDCLAKKIVSEGLASISNDREVLSEVFFKRLEKAETKAINKKKGRWASTEENLGSFQRLLKYFRGK